MTTLNELIAQTEASASADAPLERLASAARRQQDLADLGEQLLDHFVQQARAAGCSWTQVGAALGVSKQAAQQRHSGLRGLRSLLFGQLRGATAGLLTRFDREARQAVVLAQDEARLLRHDRIGTEHLLLGLLAESATPAARALAEAGLDLDRGRVVTAELLGPGEREPRGHVAFTIGAKGALEQSLRAARATKQNHISTAHLLLGLLAESDSDAVRILAHCRIEPEQLRQALRRQEGDEQSD